MNEPSITINGTQLTAAQAMTVRVAIQIFAMDLMQPDNEIGEIGPLYLQRIGEINEMIQSKNA